MDILINKIKEAKENLLKEKGKGEKEMARMQRQLQHFTKRIRRMEEERLQLLGELREEFGDVLDIDAELAKSEAVISLLS